MINIQPIPKSTFFLSSLLTSALILSSCGGGGSSNTSNSTSASTPTTPPSTEFTITGQAFKGLVKDAEIIVIGSDSIIAENAETLVRGTTNAQTGNYSLTLDTATLPVIGDYIFVTVAINSANLVCDAPTGCGESVAFGEDLRVADFDNVTTPLAALVAVVPTPRNGSSVEVNPNIFSHLSFTYFDDIVTQRSDISILQSDINLAQSRVATIFGLNDTPFHELPYIDVTRTVGSSDQNGIRAALISGGMQGPISKFEGSLGDGDGFAWGLTRLSTRFARDDGEILAREANGEDNSGAGRLSLEDFFAEAVQFDQVNSTSSNAFSLAIQSIQDDYAEILASRAFGQTSDGELLPPIPNVAPIFFSSALQARDGDRVLDISGEVFDENGPDEVITFVLNDSEDSGFFTLTLEGLLSANEPFDCDAPQDTNGDQRYELNMTISDGELETTQDITLSIFEQNGDFCAVRGQSKSSIDNQKPPSNIQDSIYELFSKNR